MDKLLRWRCEALQGRSVYAGLPRMRQTLDAAPAQAAQALLCFLFASGVVDRARRGCLGAAPSDLDVSFFHAQQRRQDFGKSGTRT